jgi:hypothetical protein
MTHEVDPTPRPFARSRAADWLQPTAFQCRREQDDGEYNAIDENGEGNGAGVTRRRAAARAATS